MMNVVQEFLPKNAIFPLFFSELTSFALLIKNRLEEEDLFIGLIIVVECGKREKSGGREFLAFTS